jgi:hypothetical protein
VPTIREPEALPVQQFQEIRIVARPQQPKAPTGNTGIIPHNFIKRLFTQTMYFLARAPAQPGGLPSKSPGFGGPPPASVGKSNLKLYAKPPPLSNAPAPGFNAPPPGFNAPPPGYNGPPPGYNGPPPGYNGPPPTNGMMPGKPPGNFPGKQFAMKPPAATNNPAPPGGSGFVGKPPAPAMVKKAPPAQRPRVQAKALYDFDAENQDELSFREGDMLNIMEQADPNWWEAELNGRRGKVPTNYLEVMKSAPPATPPPRAQPPANPTAPPQGGSVGRGRGAPMGFAPPNARGRGRGY